MKEAEEYIKVVLLEVKHSLDEESIETIEHYLDNNEAEMAFEGLFIEIMKLEPKPSIDFLKGRAIAESLNLDKDSMFDSEFWVKFVKHST